MLTFHVQDALSHAESKASQAERRAEDLAKKLELKDQELEQLQDRWREETKNIHQQTREEINSEREKLIKVLVVQTSLLDCDTVLCCGLTPTFQKNILPLSSELKEFCPR